MQCPHDRLTCQRFAGVGHELRPKVHENMCEVIIAIRKVLGAYPFSAADVALFGDKRLLIPEHRAALPQPASHVP